MVAAKELIPGDLRDFLSVEANLSFHWGRPYPVEVAEARFYSLDELSLRTFRLHTWEYYNNHWEPGDDPDHWYAISGIDLIKAVPNYFPQGILVWFPQFQEYGACDGDHAIVTMLPGVSWTEILKDPAKYVNAQWYPKRVKHYLLRPWADKRCANLLPQKERP